MYSCVCVLTCMCVYSCMYSCVCVCVCVDFIRSLMDVAAAGQEQCPLHLRQLALVLITQQVRRRYCDMRACVHSMLMEFSFAIMACSESNLKNSGVSE